MKSEKMESTALLNKCILLIEDECMIQQIIVEFLQEEGFHVVSLSNGQEALNYLGSQTLYPSLILLDLMMPVMNGRVFRREQLQNTRLAEIPVVFMTAGRITQEDLDTLVPQAVIKKPIDLDHFLETVNRFCS